MSVNRGRPWLTGGGVVQEAQAVALDAVAAPVLDLGMEMSLVQVRIILVVWVRQALRELLGNYGVIQSYIM